MEHQHAIDSEAGAERVPARAPLGRGEAAAVFAGGVVGALARASLGRSLPVHAGEWPWATFAVNVAGAAVLGYAVARLQALPGPRPAARAFLAAGLCGTVTTFSALMLELLHMLDGGRVALACGYAGASLAAGLAAVWLGGTLGAHGMTGLPPGTAAQGGRPA